MVVERTEVHAIESEPDVVKVRQIVRAWTVELKFGIVDQTRMVTAASELARNTLGHGKGGEVRMEMLQDGARRGLRLVFEDKGPGIADLTQAMTDGFTTAGGMGLGLGGTRRLVHEFEIQSTPELGTRVTICRWA